MRLVASDFYTLHRPSKCELRVYLREQGLDEAEPGPFEQVLREFGVQHEQRHREELEPVLDLSTGTLDQRALQTLEAVRGGTPVIYQGVLSATADFEGEGAQVVGEPDFLIRQDGGYVIRDSKIARRVKDKEHPEIFLQLSLYGWLYEQAIGERPAGIEIHSGTGEIVPLPYDGGRQGLEVLNRIALLKAATAEPFAPVGWSKCSGCGFRARCWPQAKANRDVALVPDVDRNLVAALHEQGITTYDELASQLTVAELAEVKKPWGAGTQRVGKKAEDILRLARALSDGREEVFATPDIPEHPNYVMFDLEGLPPQLDELEKIYLWGVQVFGEDHGEYRAATADFGEEGDRQCWEDFLDLSQAIFAEHGDIPFVHWHDYERRNVQQYIERYGDRDGVGQRVLGNLLDAWDVARKSVALPVYSYSLKVIEQYVGYERTMTEFGGEWSMARYIEAVESEDPKLQAEVMDQILTYNREDLEATWAVFEWLLNLTPAPSG